MRTCVFFSIVRNSDTVLTIHKLPPKLLQTKNKIVANTNL